MMTILAYTMVGFFALMILGTILSKRRERSLKERGLYPAVGEPATQEQVDYLIMQRQKIAAIKLYRRICRVGLKEAKENVEEIEARLQAEGRISHG